LAESPLRILQSPPKDKIESDDEEEDIPDRFDSMVLKDII
jgi:hypothetical protein